MIVDTDGNEVKPVKCVRHSNKVTVQRVKDGNEFEYDIADLHSTLGRKDFITVMRAIQTKE
jgi:hypothetical protein